MYQGAAGVDAINEALQNLLNPKAENKPEVRIYQHIFREGDKVLQLKNRPDDNVFNGDIGIIIEIQKRDGFYYQQDKIFVDFEGDIVEYTSQDFNQLLSYGTKSAIELCVVALLVGTFLAYPYVCINFATASLWWLPAIAVITVFTIFDTKGGVVSALLHKRPLLWFGSISFSFYMIHHLVIRYGEIIMEHLGLPEHPSIVIPLFLVASTVGAYIVSRFFN